MFENIIGQNAVASILQEQAFNNKLPSAILFEGPPHSAKLSTALELARFFSCTNELNKAAWNCNCINCVNHRIINQQDLMLIGYKSFYEELKLAEKIINNDASIMSSKFFFIRAVKKLLKRFDANLYANDESRLDKIMPTIRSVSELLDEKTIIETKKIIPLCEKLIAFLPDTTPVSQIRALASWARLKPYGFKKTIIIEHADRLLSSAYSVFLKILEEPPSDVIFILTTNRKQVIPQTILSRVRQYRFIVRNETDTASVISRIFKDANPNVKTLSQYVEQFKPVSTLTLEPVAKQFANALLSGNQDNIYSTILDVIKTTNNFELENDSAGWGFQLFLDLTGSTFVSMITQDNINLQRKAELFLKLSKETITQFSSYNMQPASLLEKLSSYFVQSE